MADLNTTAFDDLEIRISTPLGYRQDTTFGALLRKLWNSVAGKANAYMVMMQLSDGSARLGGLAPIPTHWGEIKDPREYGQQLFNWLFAEDSDLKRGFLEARRYAESSERSVPSEGRLRLRLSLDKAAPELHCIWWEAIFDATRDRELALEVPMSRFVKVGRPRLWPVIERPLRMCVVISSPPGLDAFGCKPLDVSLEKELVSEAVADLRSVIKPHPILSPTPAQFAGAIAEIRPHIVYVLAHAVYTEDGSGGLLFCAEGSGPTTVPFAEFAKLVLPPQDDAPYLVILALPLEARVDNTNSLALLGQMLVAGGVQAVLAVHAPLPKQELLNFTEGFFDDLLRTGIVDTAVMAARRRIYKPGDWSWTFPVLYLRAPDAVLFEPFLATSSRS
jgi:hypothetical protein